ncbi:DNA glycosylase AlkZ-like family protein [Nocardioides limicola]|uniref:DNA glycosylase AlkZ-like family protein n=1 Tax=Nocardioides limicola TaxID=2803368 RepID=UPI00193C670B|nr:crosslink repair DNA glycosylase YcaQ family protein [Nocardioides sp. DJM-14]
MTVELSRTDAHRIAVTAQLLARPRPVDLLAMLGHLTVVQADPTAVVAENADLVCWSRLGAAHRIGDLDAAIAAGTVVEFQGLLRPAGDIALFTAEMAQWRGSEPFGDWRDTSRGWLVANEDCRRDILAHLESEGPSPSTALPDTTVVPWQSSGWNNDRNVRMMLDLMERRGDVAVAGRDGRERLWEVAERVYPPTLEVGYDEALRERAQRRLIALGVARPASTKVPGEPNHVGDVGEPAVIEGLRGRWRVHPAYLEAPWEPRAALLSPLDRLVFDRKRMAELFDFDYQLEMYKPKAKRRWGYWAMPILYGDRLIGKLDATADRREGELRVDRVHRDEVWPEEVAAAVTAEIEALADWLGLALVRLD